MIYTTEVPHLNSGIRSAVTLGKFDGFHRGHQKLVECIKQKSGENCRTIIFTFDLPYKAYQQKCMPKLLLTYEEKREVAEALHADILAECPFTEELMNMEPEAFVKEYLVDRLHAEYVAIGSDFHFGHNRSGNPEVLSALGEKYGFTVEIIEKERDGERKISSTYIREELEQGRMEKVQKLLGYPYFIKGEIVHGRQLGRTIGVPTANLIPPPMKKLPPNGVYVTQSSVGGKVYSGITNVGYKPTVKENFIGVETYLFHCNENLYGQEAEVRFYKYLRPEKKFDSLSELKTQLDIDVETARAFFEKEYGQALELRLS